MSTIIDTPGPSLRGRLLRPNRWRLSVQFALLGAFVVIIPILLTSNQLLDAGRRVLVEHEIVDLSDESNLRVTEMREDMSYLARDVRRAALNVGVADPNAIVASLEKEVSALPSNAQPMSIPNSVRDSRKKYMAGTVVGYCVFRAGEQPGQVDLLALRPGPDQARLDLTQGIRECLLDITTRALRKQPVYNSSLHLDSPASGPRRSLIAIGGIIQNGGPRDRPLLSAVILDFTRYIDNRRRISPRHAYLVTDPTGVLFVHPDPTVPIGTTRLPDLIPWKYPVDPRGESWFTPTQDPAAREQRFAVAVHNGGARLSMIPVPELQAQFRKGSFGQTLESLFGDQANVMAARLNQMLAEETAQDPLLRCGEVIALSEYIEIAHRDSARLRKISEMITAWFAAQAPGKKISWSSDLPCRTFQGQLTPLRVDLNDEDPPAWLIVAAAAEELREDIDDRFREVQYRWVLPTLGISSILGIALVLTLTWSLQRLARAAGKISAGRENVHVPLGGPYEVSQLAYVLDDMVKRVAERDHELRERAARYETILRAAGEGIVITNSAGLIEEANKAAGRMFGYKPEELIGRPVHTLVNRPDVLTSIDSSLPGDGQGVSRSLDTVQGVRKNGTQFWLDVSLKPVPLPGRVVVTCVFRDISQRKEAEERIRRMNDQLEERVSQRTAELEEANGKLEIALKQAEQASRAKDTFVANMSHELRQPLHIIIGFAEALREEAEDLNAEAIIPDLDKILSAARHLLDLINDILDMARLDIDRVELNLTRFDLNTLLSGVKDLQAPLAKKNANIFEIDAPADLGAMIADERRVRQVLINLLSNAFKFTQNGKVTLKVRQVFDAGRPWFHFTVTDTGKGMTPEQVSRLFQRFYQADASTTREQGGSGLGLAITSGLIEAMGGPPVRVDSEVGVGSTFEVTLPVEVTLLGKGRNAAKLPPPVLAPQEPAAAAGRTVLVIDDDAMVRELMSRFLSKEGFKVLLADSGDAGIKLAHEHRPNVITLDVMMPGTDGWQILSRLKADPILADTPVVMLTIVDDRGRGYALGAADYLNKPIDWQRLGSILRRYLRPGQAEMILVVDDNENNREVIRRFLERQNYQVVEASDGEAGLKAFAEKKPALVFLDLMMPVLDGFGFLDELEKRHPGHGVPVVVLTAKELTSTDFDRLNGRVTKILEKDDLSHVEKWITLIRRHAVQADASERV